MGRTKLSLVAELTPEQQAERELEILASSFSESLNTKLLKEIFRVVTVLRFELEAMKSKPRHDPEELVGGHYLEARFEVGSNSANLLMHKIGVIRTGPNGGSLRVRLSDVDRYEQDPVNYQQRDRRAA